MGKEQKSLLIIAGCVLALFLGLKLTENLPSIFSPLQQNIFIGTIISFILVIGLKELLNVIRG